MLKAKATGTSKLLLHEQPLQVLPGLAVALGLNEAIILQQLHYWLGRKAHIRDDREWHYNTYEDWKKQFPFWSVSTIKRAIVHLEKEGVITAANYNNSNIDKTKWYAINYDKLNTLCDSSMAHIDPSMAHIDPSMAHIDPSMAHIDPMDGSYWPHQDPETNSENKPRKKEDPPPLASLVGTPPPVKDAEASHPGKATKTPKGSRRCPPDYTPNPQVREWAATKYPAIHFEDALEAMRDHEFRFAHSDWNATLRTWIRTEDKQRPSSNGVTKRARSTADMTQAEWDTYLSTPPEEIP
jgi:hypothetical protein